MKRTATAQWTGTLKDGNGTLTTKSGVLSNTHYSFTTRFEDSEKGTNPEELLAAAHAGCFTMAVSSMITAKGLTTMDLQSEAQVTMEGLSIIGVHLIISGKVEGMTEEDFITITEMAAKTCIISKALSIKITSEAKFNK
jgi:osmotically inducible protein OsmC